MSDEIARGVSGGPGLDARDVNRLERFRDFNADVGGYVKKKQGVVVRRVPLVGGGAAIPLAPRHGGHAHGDGRDREGHLPAVPAPEARRLCAARDLRAIELFHCRHEPADPDERCVAEHRISRERMEGRVQRRRDRRALPRSARRRLSFRRADWRSRARHRAFSTLVRTRSAVAPWRRSGSSTVRRPMVP